MKIAVLGAGGIGSTFAACLVRAGHEVTVVARGKRLAQLKEVGGIKTSASGHAATRVDGTLPTEEPFDLVLVTVLESQVGAVLPALRESAARQVMFMFNTFASLEDLRDAVGEDRFAFGFPSVLAQVNADGVLHTDIQKHGLLTTVTDAALARVFTDAGIPAVVTPDMTSWLRAHAAAIVPFMLAVGSAHARRAGIPWAHASQLSAAMKEAFALVKRLGHPIIPAAVGLLSHLPRPLLTLLLWGATRIASLRASGASGTREPAALIDQMVAASAPKALPALVRVRPREGT